MKPTVLIVDDEPLFVNLICRALASSEFDLIQANNGKDAVKQFHDFNPDIVLLDLGLPDMSGLTLLKEMKNLKEETEFIMITGQGGVKEAVEAIKLGAMDYICKPVNLEEFKAVIFRLIEVWKLKIKMREFNQSQENRYSFQKIVRKSRVMDKMCNLAERVALSGSSTVLIQGETGTGKGMLASAIHYNSPRKDNSFVNVNCATLLEGLLESELFGHEKGAFTGAIKRKMGKFELADKGTIFLDEIGEMSLNLQAKLLKVIEEKHFERVGGTTPIKVDVRLIASTNRNLANDVKDGRFREDLFYRLNVVPIHIPPLRERKEDIPIIAMHLLEEYKKDFGKRIKGFSKDAMDFIENYEWKGNVRELKNFIERAVLLTNGDTIQLDKEYTDEVRTKTAGAAASQDFTLASLDDMELSYVKKVVEMEEGNKSKAANILGITRQRLRRILKEE
ncbi:MAG: sigma-54-dependent Fis family transcriptional regulator [Deltaproteobacteria bacterium]|nr:sigma-54-dependent Fis family transcriptional regulator [Deltaproteobacteria bacterium]